jgi:rubrerythrin
MITDPCPGCNQSLTAGGCGCKNVYPTYGYYGYLRIGAQQGWQCPVCNAVNSPWSQQCPCGGELKTFISNTGEEEIDE